MDVTLSNGESSSLSAAVKQSGGKGKQSPSASRSVHLNRAIVVECIHIKPRCCDENAAFPIYFQWEPRGTAAADVDFCCRFARQVKLRQAQLFGCCSLRHIAAAITRLTGLTAVQHSKPQDSSPRTRSFLMLITRDPLALHNPFSFLRSVRFGVNTVVEGKRNGRCCSWRLRMEWQSLWSCRCCSEFLSLTFWFPVSRHDKVEKMLDRHHTTCRH